MKKLMVIMAILGTVMPAIAACPVNGNSCAYSITEPPLKDKYLPDNIEQIQKPDAFRPTYVVPYRDALINTETGGAAQTPGTNEYNSNCQFGVCMPGREPGPVEVIE